MQTVSRLTDHFQPTHYDLSLSLQRTERTFNGTVTLTGVAADFSQQITLHSKELTIDSVTLDGSVADFGSSDNDELAITAPGFKAGKHIVTIVFSGAITDAMHGLYPCYFEHNGQKKELLATQFESHHAREVFPCIDEPEAKATFDVTLTTEQGITVLGNMPIKHQRTENDLLVTAFERTPRMSSYLLAWVAGELHKKTATTNSGVEVNIWATPAQPAESLDFALDIATRTIDFYDEYFGTPYPLPKSDHVALPDFSSGAMENWGLVTYREVALLADPATVSITSKHYIATVIAHELAHQWFGNLVTMKWWNNLWLNESFATLMEYIAVDALQPDWNVWLDFASYESIISLRRDSIEGVQAVQIDVNHPDEISTLFDGAIVYAKGARLLRMAQQYIGHEAFQTGLKAYFEKHAYANTEANDLWNELSVASNKDITGLMNTWISQSGFPVLHVTNDNGQVILAQEQFFVGPHEPSTKLWPIPLNSTCSEMPELLSEKTVTIARHHTTPLRFNVGDTAHFVTHLDAALLVQVVDQLERGELSPIDRLQLLHEQTLLARAGITTSAELIPLLDAYRTETAESVWDIISVAIGELKKFVEDNKLAEDALRSLAGRLARDQYERLGWSITAQESETDTKLRAIVISLILYSEDADAIRTALELYANTPLEELGPELRSIIISTAVRHGNDQAIVDTLLERHNTTSSAELKQDIAAGITSTKDPFVIQRLLELTKDTTVVRPQDTTRWFVSLLRGREGRALAWQWLRDNWTWIEATFAGDKSYDDYPRYAASALVTRAQLEEYITFFTPMLDAPALSRVISIGISELEGRIALIERDSATVQDKLLK